MGTAQVSAIPPVVKKDGKEIPFEELPKEEQDKIMSEATKKRVIV